MSSGRFPANRQVGDHSSECGIITMGLPFLSLMDVLEGADWKPDILKLGIVHPLARKRIARFLAAHREVKVLEELEGDKHRKVEKTKTRRVKKEPSQQISFFGQKVPVLEELEELDINSLTPLEALTKLYELQKKAREG